MSTPWRAVATLLDPVRRALYQHVCTQPRPVSREAAAKATGVSRSLAAFHLEKLVAVGLLAAEHQTPRDRPHGPGRAPKMYRPSGVEVSLTLPERRYDLIGEILAEAVARRPQAAADAARVLARQRGVEIGQAARPAPVAEVLAGLGYEPVREGETLVLRNCPFHRLAARETELVCGINLCFTAGLLDGLSDTAHQAVLAPGPESCCVQLRSAET